jgi:molybdopterin molybdotransferase
MTSQNASNLQALCPVTVAIEQLAAKLTIVPAESMGIEEVAGRILASDLSADRDSPATDVSAMDGYALRYADYQPQHDFPIAGTCSAGQPAIELKSQSVAKIFTGAPMPAAADTVIERESAEETDASVVRFAVNDAELRLGRHVRKKGENIRSGETVLASGTIVSAAAIAAIASFGSTQLSVYRKVRVSVLNTGNELVAPGQPAEPWQIRDSNGPVLQAILAAHPYLHLIRRMPVPDEEAALRAAIDMALSDSDVVLLTGGVSMGDYDYVPKVLQESGVEKVFHRLPIKPGKPIFGGVGPSGQLVCGLPGNPVSVAVTCRRIAIPIIQYIAGSQRTCLKGSPVQTLVHSDESTIPLVHFRLAEMNEAGQVYVEKNKGSGDLVSLSRSTGFVEYNPFIKQPGEQRKFYRWQ